MLPPKVLTVLISLKRELVSQIQAKQSVMITQEKPRKPSTSTIKMRHARRPNGYQRWMQNHGRS